MKESKLLWSNSRLAWSVIFSLSIFAAPLKSASISPYVSNNCSYRALSWSEAAFPCSRVLLTFLPASWIALSLASSRFCASRSPFNSFWLFTLDENFSRLSVVFIILSSSEPIKLLARRMFFPASIGRSSIIFWILASVIWTRRLPVWNRFFSDSSEFVIRATFLNESSISLTNSFFSSVCISIYLKRDERLFSLTDNLSLSFL